jgi:NADPH-dependent curcumin reductase CurA
VQDFARSDGSGVSKLDPDGLLKLLAGENLGKLVLAVQ